MSRLLRRLISAGNLGRDPRISGQIATLLLLATVVLLTFVLVTVNVGNVSMQSTSIANAADTSALYLASALATKSRQLYEGLENHYDQCYNTGMASIIIAIVLIVVIIVLTVMTCGAGAVTVAAGASFIVAAQAVGTVTLMAVGAVAGAIGGAIGAGIAGTDPARGALTGAALGAACGAIVGAAVAAPALGTTTATAGTSSASITSSSTLSIMAADGSVIASTGAAGGTVTALAGTVTVGVGSIAGLGTGIMGALSVGSGIYNEITFQGEHLKAIDDIVKALGKATETDRIRETAIIKALTQLIDDPNLVVDDKDSDFDGNTEELVPAAQVWFFERTKHIRALTNANEGTINSYLYQLNWMMEYLWQFVSGSGPVGAGHIPGILELQEYRFVIERDLDGMVSSEEIVSNEGNDGVLASAFRALEANVGCGAACDLSFWDSSGPSVAQYTELINRNCLPDGACEGEAERAYLRSIGYDQFDALVAGMRDAVYWVDTLMRQDPKARAATWDQWVDMLYSEGEDPDATAGGGPLDLPETTSTLYGMLYHYELAIREWMVELRSKWNAWPECVMDSSGGYANAPCRVGEWGGSFDREPDDEYSTTIMFLRDYILPSLQWTRGYLKDMVMNLRGGGTGLNRLGGRNPVVYEWDDARGHHWLKAKIGDFKIPKIEKRKYGNWFAGKTCMELTNFTSEPNPIDHKGRSAATYNKCWVQVWRFDQPKNLGLLGTWNPFRRPLTKKANCYYSWDRVGLKE